MNALLLALSFLTLQTARASVDSTEAQSNGDSTTTALSGNGRVVAFCSLANNLVSGDSNLAYDVFVRDTSTGKTTRVSVASDGAQANDSCWEPALSANGRFVAFATVASNLVAGDVNGMKDIFVHDRKSGVTTRVSVNNVGTEADGISLAPALSADGRFVAFSSGATNLVSGDTNGRADVFVHDRKTGETTRVSVGSLGEQSDGHSYEASLSANGRLVAFYSYATSLVLGDANGIADCFVHDRQTGKTTRVSVDSLGGEASKDCYAPVISGNGRFVAFATKAADLAPGDGNGSEDVIVHDRKSGKTSLVGVDSFGVQGNAWCAQPAISSDGRRIAFRSVSSNLVPDDTNSKADIFVRTRKP